MLVIHTVYRQITLSANKSCRSRDKNHRLPIYARNVTISTKLLNDDNEPWGQAGGR